MDDYDNGDDKSLKNGDDDDNDDDDDDASNEQTVSVSVYLKNIGLRSLITIS